MDDFRHDITDKMKKNVKIYRYFPPVIFTFLYIFFTQNLSADTIVLNDGRSIEGEIIQESAYEITIQSSGMNITIQRTRIISIKRGSLNNPFVNGDLLLRQNKFLDALDEYKNLQPLCA